MITRIECFPGNCYSSQSGKACETVFTPSWDSKTLKRGSPESRQMKQF